MICEACLGVLQARKGLVENDPEENLFLHHKDISSLQRSATSGCYFCLRMWESVPDDEKPILESVNCGKGAIGIQFYATLVVLDVDREATKPCSSFAIILNPSFQDVVYGTEKLDCIAIFLLDPSLRMGPSLPQPSPWETKYGAEQSTPGSRVARSSQARLPPTRPGHWCFVGSTTAG